MRGKQILGAAVLILLATSCVWPEPENHPIPPGVFHSGDGVEQIVVGDRGMYFMIKAVDGRIGEYPGKIGPYIAFYPSMFIDKTRKYTVGEDGEIHLYLYISSDPFLEFQFVWHEDLDKISKVVPRTGETMWFSRPECEGPEGSCANEDSQ